MSQQLPPGFGGPALPDDPKALKQLVQQLMAQQAQLRAQVGQLAAQVQAGGQVRLCVQCANDFKLASMKVGQELARQGLEPGSPEHQQKYMEAVQAGAVPDPNREDLVVNGTGLCLPHLVPNPAAGKQPSQLLAATMGMSLDAMRNMRAG